jgi:hypothetical protein
MLLAHLVSGRYGNPEGENPVRMAAPARAGWFSRLIALFSAKR